MLLPCCFRCLCLLPAFFLVFLSSVRAAPPRPGEIEQYRKDGTLAERTAFTRSMANDRFDPDLLLQARYKLQRAVMEAQGISPEAAEGIAAAPPPAWRGMPSTGTARVLCLLVEFQDLVHHPANSQQAINNALFGAGDAAEFPYESLQNYYKRASYNKLNLTGNTLGWYRTPYPRSQVPQTPAGRQALIREVINHYAGQGHDFSQYDNDGDGDIDLFYVIYAGENNGWGNFWWAYQTEWSDNSFRPGGKRLAKYVFQFQNYDASTPFTPRVIIHETGHALGIPDFYDYEDAVGPRGGVGGLDMMDGNQGDHNCFSKWVLGWLTPRVVSSGSQTIALRASGTSEDCLLIMPGASTGAAGQFSEFFMVQNRTKAGNDDAGDWAGAGLMIWHIDSTLDGSGNDYAFDNSYTAHKLLRLMEADGREEIEAGVGGNAGDFYTAGKLFTPSSTPNSRRYGGADSRVQVTNISAAGPTMTAQFTITGDGTPPTVTITSPAGGASFQQGNPVAVTANASDDGSVASVSFYANGALIGTDESAPYAAEWTGAPGGSHLLTAVATDNLGLTATSTAVSIRVATVGGPANDAFAARAAITGNTQTVSGTNVNSSPENGEPQHFNRAPATSVWWQWTPALTGTATVTTEGSNFDTVLAAYSGSALANLTGLQANDDGPAGRTSVITFPVTAGTPVQLAVDGYDGATGSITLKVEAVAAELNNDAFAGATGITNAGGRVTVTGSNAAAGAEAGEPEHFDYAPRASVWWKWTAPENGSLEVSTAGSNFDTVLAVYTGANLAGLTEKASNDDHFNDRTSWVGLAVTAGTVYYIAVDGYDGATGSVTLETAFFTNVAPPSVTLTRPREGESFSRQTLLAMTAEASAAGGTIAEVRFSVDNELAATVPNRAEQVEYRADSSLDMNGYYRITATAVDSRGAQNSVSVDIIVSEVSLTEAVDSEELVFLCEGDQFWHGVEEGSHDDSDAAAPVELGNDESAAFYTTVTGPGVLTYWWRSDSEKDFDFLRFYYDGQVQEGSLSGDSGWVQASWAIPSGSHVVKWAYEKDAADTGGTDTARVDQITWLTPPQITGDATVSAATGFPFTYQIRTDVNATSFAIAGGTLPPGLTLNTQNGVISGTPQQGGSFNVTLKATNLAGDGTRVLTFNITSAIAIPEAVDAPALTWTGEGSWFGQAGTSHDGADAARSGITGDNQENWIQTQVTGPGTLTFWWKVDSEKDYDFLRFEFDGVVLERISGATDWAQYSYAVPAGTRTLRWTYAKDETVSEGTDAGWVDQVSFTTGGGTGYAAWATANNLTGERAMPGANPDGDAFVNQLEYAFGLDPQSAASQAGGPVAAWDAVTRRVSLTFTRRPVVTDLVYEVESSTDLAAWTVLARSTGGAVFATVGQGAHTVTEAASGADRTVTFTDGVSPAAASLRRYLRVKVRTP